MLLKNQFHIVPKWVLLIVLFHLCSCGSGRSKTPNDQNVQTNDSSAIGSNDDNVVCECESEEYMAICNPITYSTDNDSASIYDNPVTRTDTTYNESPISLYATLEDCYSTTSVPVNSIKINGTKVKCVKIITTGDENSGYYEKHINLLYNGKLFWAKYFVFSTVNEDLPDKPHFTISSYQFYFKPVINEK